MNSLEKIKKLLINNEIPTQELIDYQVDKIVSAMIESNLSGSVVTTPLVNAYQRLTEDQTITVRDNNKLECYAKQKDFDKVLEMLEISLSRCYPYLTLNDKIDPFYQKENYLENENEKIVLMKFSLKLEITPSMKLHQKLQNNLDQKIESKPKIKI